MKILLDARLIGSENAGLGRYITNLVDELSRQDKDNDYVILLRKKYFETLVLPNNWKKVLADFRHYSFKEQIVIPQIINKEKPDLTHFPHFNVPFFFRGKFVVTIHDMLMHKSAGLSATTLPAPLYFVKRLGYRAVFDNAVRKSEAVITPSQAVKDELVDEYGIDSNKVKVTYEGVDKKISGKSDIKMSEPYFVYIGNAYPHKNLARLVEAIKILNTKSDHRIFLVIASSRNIFTQRIERIIHKIGAEDLVKFIGFVPDEKLGGLLRNSTGFIFPSLSEGFGLPGLEALSSGTLLLASNIKVFKEIYGDNALYFDPLDTSSMVNSMKMALMVSPAERAKKILNSTAFVNKYSWAKMARETLDIYVQSSNSVRQSK